MNNYVITWNDPSASPTAKAPYWYNRSRTVTGYSRAVRGAKGLRDRYGMAILWDERGPSNATNHGLDHSYKTIYSRNNRR